jgi:hypothetical protein
MSTSVIQSRVTGYGLRYFVFLAQRKETTLRAASTFTASMINEWAAQVLRKEKEKGKIMQAVKATPHIK